LPLLSRILFTTTEGSPPALLTMVLKGASIATRMMLIPVSWSLLLPFNFIEAIHIFVIFKKNRFNHDFDN
jgi:hypothetical protein